MQTATHTRGESNTQSKSGMVRIVRSKMVRSKKSYFLVRAMMRKVRTIMTVKDNGE